MVKASIDYLFTDERSTKPTRDWAELLRASKDKYANCRVVSLTRVKDLNSTWKHEYVQFVVEETGSKERARVYAERGNEKDLDWVTFGPVETKATGSKHGDDLPLPLTSLIFGGESGEDVNKRPTVLEIAEILAATTLIGGAYSKLGHHCFWYAYTAYDATKRQFGQLAKEKRWRWGDIGGAGNAGIKDAIGLGWSTLFRFLYVVRLPLMGIESQLNSKRATPRSSRRRGRQAWSCSGICAPSSTTCTWSSRLRPFWSSPGTKMSSSRR